MHRTLDGELTYNYPKKNGLRPKIILELEGIHYIALFASLVFGIPIVPGSPPIRVRVVSWR